MAILANKKILLGISGGIAAYKSAQLVRLLTASGADVRVVMTQSACQFITPLTLQALSGHSVFIEQFDVAQEAVMSHIELARWADFIIIAPGSANTMAKLAHGLADELLTTVCLASSCKIAVAVAMNQAMWHNQATQANIALLKSRDISILGPGQGQQACGDFGPGRMLEPEDIVYHIESLVFDKFLANTNILLTSGPTREAIDPVRYISNHSSGKMGSALARAAQLAGARVTMVSGPTAQPNPFGVNTLRIESAQQMYEQVRNQLENTDIFIAVAAVSDYRVKTSAPSKIKKKEDNWSIELVPNTDILAAVASQDRGPFTVGFAAETDNVVNYAMKKLVKKNIDLIFANDVSNKSIGFDQDDNEIVALWKDHKRVFKKAPKDQLSLELISLVAQLYKETKNNE